MIHQVSDSFNIYNKRGNTNMGSSRRNATKNKVPNTSRHDSSKSTPSNVLAKTKEQMNNPKNVQSTGNMLTITQGIFKQGNNDQQVQSHRSGLVGLSQKKSNSTNKNYRTSVSSRTGTILRPSQSIPKTPTNATASGV